MFLGFNFGGILETIAPIATTALQLDLQRDQSRFTAETTAATNAAAIAAANAQASDRRYELLIVAGLALAGIWAFTKVKG